MARAEPEGADDETRESQEKSEKAQDHGRASTPCLSRVQEAPASSPIGFPGISVEPCRRLSGPGAAPERSQLARNAG